MFICFQDGYKYWILDIDGKHFAASRYGKQKTFDNKNKDWMQQNTLQLLVGQNKYIYKVQLQLQIQPHMVEHNHIM